MNKILSRLLFLFIAVFLSANARAWTRIPATPSDDQPAAKTKPKKAKPAEVKNVAPPVSVTPVQPVLPKPSSVPTVKPAAVPSTTTTQPVKPSIITVQPPAVKTAVPIKEKSKPSRQTNKTQSFEWIVGAGLEMGGEELGQVTYSDGSTASVNANNGLMFYVGGLIPNGNNSDFSTQISLGYKTGGPRIWSSDVNWSAIPLDIIEHYRMDNMRLGLGISYHINPQLKVNLPTANFINKYNNAIGLILQISWSPIKENYSFDLRYSSIKFQQSDLADAPLINGSVGGFYATYRF